LEKILLKKNLLKKWEKLAICLDPKFKSLSCLGWRSANFLQGVFPPKHL
jgi:hypothetical protein